MNSFQRIRDWFWIVFLPLSLLWAALAYLRRRSLRNRTRRKGRLPVVCVGNVHAGGTGKTPLVAAIARELKEYVPIILSRGYGGTYSRMGAWVNPLDPNGAALYGDEPVYLARTTGCAVRIGANRWRSVVEAEKKFPRGFFLMDDGFQNFGMKHDLDIVVLPESSDWSSQYCHPLGDLREGGSSLRHASVAVILQTKVSPDGRPMFHWRKFLATNFPSLSVFEVRACWGGFHLEGVPISFSANDRVGVFCGIANPGRFFTEARHHVGNQMLVERVFPDHRRYTETDLKSLNEVASNQGLTHWLTTEKDLVRLYPGALTLPVVTARVEYEIPESLIQTIRDRLENHGA